MRKSGLSIPQAIYDKLFSKNWVIYAKQPFSKPEFVIEYLGRYTHKIAISNHRIQHINYQNKTVTFRAKNYKNEGQKQLLTLTSQEFIRRFGLHILPKGFTRIRHYGILSSSWKKEKLPALQALLCATKSSLLKHPKTTEMVHRKCPSCKKGVLQTLLLFDQRGPPKEWLKKIKV